ncbi:hypothetical protein K1T71_004832 [Dendrolimus kikuchii]|uniref:Uncharacterized protein n=1 Tax=Dendrolimus kikuchii TaxID=765133 RepID=A0ACC1D5N7_9NEOP|nr:hypothetical protein K1T71_004832 [Dendrolimus kikuchii]
MLGLLVVGPISDRLGRKKALVMTGVVGGILGLAKSFSQWYWLYIALEFFESAIGDICSPVYVLNIEIVSKSRRVPYYILCGLGYCVGGVVMPFVAWMVPYWRNYLRVIYAPALLFFFYLYLIDESPRWLMTKGEKKKAIKILEKAAEKNKIELDKKELDNIVCEKEKNVDFGKLMQITFSSRTLVKRFLVCVIWWTTSTFVHYGMTINSVSLEGNKYMNFALMSLTDIPGSFVIMYVLTNFKRKVPLMASFFVGAILCMSQPFMPENLPWLSTIVYFGGKLMSSFYFNITYIYTSELFPTYTRNSMHALCSSLGRIGSILAPQTPLLMAYWPGLPAMIFGAMSLIGGLVTFLVPDTANTSLPDTVRQAEAVGNKEKMNKIGINYDTFGQMHERNISVVSSIS